MIRNFITHLQEILCLCESFPLPRSTSRYFYANEKYFYGKKLFWRGIIGVDLETVLKNCKISLFSGSYQFKLTVKDKDGNEDSKFISVTVNQDSNAAPVAQVIFKRITKV